MTETRPSKSEMGQISGGRSSESPEAFSHHQRSAVGERPPPLFRPEALEIGSGSKFGQPIAYLPVSWRIMSALLMVMAASALVVLSVYRFERKETVVGVLRPEAGDVQVVSPDRGVITNMNVYEGKNVRAGDTLFVVSTDRADGAGGLSQLKALDVLDQQEVSLRQRLLDVTSTGELQSQMLTAQIQALEASLTTARAALRSAKAQLAIAQDDYDRAKPVAENGFISRYDMRRREMTLISAGQAVDENKGAIARLEAQIKEQRAAAAARPFSTAREQGDLEDALAEIAQRHAQYALSRGYEIRAPITGQVTALQANVGQTVDPLKPLVAILPSDGKLVAVLYVASRGVGFLKAGQSVRIRYDAFPYQRFGAVTARIASISQTVLRPEEVTGAVRVEEPVYRVVALLDRQTIDAFGERRQLHPGMALQADIVLERRSVIGALFSPLLARGGHFE